ncbi:exported hypothetical protein [Gammaproteobacteria bacterium]
MRSIKISLWCGLSLAFGMVGATPAVTDPGVLFQQHCAVCHGADRLGLTGPALLPESLERLRKPEAVKTLREGRTATQMAGFADKLSAAEIEGLVDWVYTPVTPTPTWDEAWIRASRVVHHPPGNLPDHPIAALTNVDLMNLFLVVESGDHHVTVLVIPVSGMAGQYARHWTDSQPNCPTPLPVRSTRRGERRVRHGGRFRARNWRGNMSDCFSAIRSVPSTKRPTAMVGVWAARRGNWPISVGSIAPSV